MVNLLFLDLLGGVALLLWGLHMVHSGVVRAFGSDLRHLLNVALRNRFSAFLAGILVTALLQSSTATGLMTTSFAAGGLVALVPALAIMLGANVGTALIVQVLSFNVSAVAPVLLLVGIIAFRRGGRTRTRDLGRVAIGLGLMLLALHILLDTLAPAEQAPQVHELFAVFTSQPIVCVFLAAVLTWAAHSSVAVVLLVMSLAYSHFISPVGALALVLGANLGSAINPVLEGSKSADPASRRVPIGNLLNRVIGVAATLPLLPQIVEIFGRFQLDPARMTAEFHLAFNVALALIFIGLLDGMAWLLMRILPEQKKPADPAAPLYLDETAIDTPSVALACAARETLHMGDIVETMLRDSITAVMADDRKLVAQLSRMDNIVDRLDEAIKFYVTKITRESLDDRDGRRAMEIISFTINLEHIGDIIDKNLMELAAKKIKHRYQFSKEGAAELVAFHQRTLDNLKLAFGVFMSGDIKVARKLLAEKAALREAELSAAENHLARLREGRPESIETSSLHLDILRDLKRIHSHICSVAYPVLETAGELEPSRLKRTDDVLALPNTLSVRQSSQPPTEQAS
ncbi:MAG: Na/Pi cotransporter family protein [Alphaproteobacteria bacterium]|nr:MAG: Na/Pi cotransporter family protein [Alphaproteobacteria bacterium]HMC63595.1 Na/Pi cotransporter family protein [Gemmataceae bacterium]HYT16207.1 Na/Pi cotransporter family protein [Burkholderiales bacterium]